MSKHTAGPWEVESYLDPYNAHPLTHHVVSDSLIVAKCGGEGFEKKGNAHLIAQAPALLEELEDRYHETKCGCGHPACRRCQADAKTLPVINKAKGETEC